MQVTVFPLYVVAVILAVPTLFAVTKPPEALTPATLELLLEYAIWYAASPLGSELLRSNVSPMPRVNEVLLRLILVGAFLTATEQEAVAPLRVVILTVAPPTFNPATSPVAASTFTISGLLVVNTASDKSEPVGELFMSVYFSPTPSVNAVLLSSTVSGSVGSVG